MEIIYYTDPLCCWSWGMEPAIQKIRYEFEGKIEWRYCMGGLIPCWDNYYDPVNNVSRPLQMGPVWMHAARITGATIDHNLWYRDPPSSSYPPCIAFKSVQLQSLQLAEIYLGLMREACMLKGINISSVAELVKLARELQLSNGGFDVARFTLALTKGEGLEAFRSDLKEVQSNNISRFPTLIFRERGRASLITTGYRTYNFLMDVIQELSPGLKKTRESEALEAATERWQYLPAQQLNETEKNECNNPST